MIDAAGKVEKVWEKVSPAGHAEQVLAYLAGDLDPPVKKSSPAKKAVDKNAVAKKIVSKAVKKTS